MSRYNKQQAIESKQNGIHLVFFFSFVFMLMMLLYGVAAASVVAFSATLIFRREMQS